ncbi:MAG: NADH-quinone oxidoreductase subunit [Acidimicrobiaceae bacterium]
MPDEEITLTVNGREISAPKGQLVIAAAEQHGVFIPRFCYHPRMKSVGMCRMCIVDIDTGRGPALLPACMIEVAPDMKVDTESATTKKAQDGVLEFLLINHPLDCPVCDKGGECPLQDNAYAYGPGESRFVEEKRHFEKPIPVSDVVFLDRERCILCDRCTRFADEVAGDPLIHFQNRGNETEVNTFPDHPFASYFSGNTVQICPVGALTAKPFRFKARPWDLEKVESTCTSCSVGCRVTIEASRNHVLRYQGVDIDPVNWGWLCDKGRFDFEAIESDDRLSEPLVRKPSGATDGTGELIAASWAEAIGAAADAIRNAEASAVAVLGGARLTNEAAYAWAKLAKGVIGTDHVDAQLDDGLPGVAVVGLPQATIDDVCAPGATVIVVDANLKEELPVLFLRLRDAVINRGVKVVELSSMSTGLAALAAVSLVHRPGEAHLAMRALVGDGDAAAVLDGDLDAAKALTGGNVVAIVGRSSVGESAAATVEAAAVLLDARADTRFLVALRRANVRGAVDMGLAPGLLPGRVTLDDGRQWFHEHWSTLPDEEGLDATGILTAAAEGRIDVLVLLGADPAADFRDHDLAQRALAGARTVVSIDTFMNRSTEKADVVLPAAGYAETDGTTTNVEGRVSVLERKVTPPGTARADWMLAAELAYRLGADLGLESVEDIWNEIEALAPAHAGITRELLLSPAGADGVLVPLRPEVAQAAEGQPVQITGIEGTEPDNAALAEAAEPSDDAGEPEPEAVEAVTRAEEEADARPDTVRFSRSDSYESPAPDAYSLRLIAHRKLYDLGTLVQHAPSIAELAPGSTLLVHPYDLDRLGVSDGGRVKVTSPRTTLTVEAHASTIIPKGSAALTVNQPGPDPADLIDATQPVTDVRIETV